MLSAPASGGRFHGGAPLWRILRPRSCLASPPASSSGGGEPGRAKPLLVERYRDGVAKRYILDGDSKLQVRLEKHESPLNAVADKNANPLLPRAIRDFILPAGFPGSVSDDYLEYMLLQFPTNVTGWICHVLVTSSLLKAVGVGSFTGTSAAASAAAIRWVSKDGIGAFGRLLIGGRFGTLFDDDPKKWRMYADFIGSAGRLLPPTCIVGESCKGGSMGSRSSAVRPFDWCTYYGYRRCKIIVRNSYFNMAERSSSTSLVPLSVPSNSQVPHSKINLKRGRILVRSHVSQHMVPGYVACNEEENILTWERFLHPRISFGVPMGRLLGGEESSDMVNRLLKLYRNERYILFVEQFESREPTFLVTFKESATSMSVLRSLWQAHWLHNNQSRQDEVFSWLEESLVALEHEFPDFLKQMEGAGWDQNQIILKVPKEPVLVSEHLD
ncbi:protein root UVB sensitive 5 isoform X3 [Phragmites australis]|uniref:protein root UVB sensitive 5 isoform X3 n=1 Tax=Phragmites australis TaxID=29695 RepID=UPI002D76D3DA|nr:protein root UVB sensitive 5 isoform X3 [Phragmites australis]